MYNKIKVDTTRLNNDAKQVQGCIRQMQNSMQNMKSSVAELDAMWDGPGSEAFKKVFRDDMELLEIMINNLSNINGYEMTAKAEYEACERKVAELIGNIRI